MKRDLLRLSVFLIFLLGIKEFTYAYITMPSTSYSLEVGTDKYLSVPNASYGYIDKAIWTCSSSDIIFKEKDEAGAIIQISRAFTGTAVIEVVATEKYLDNNNQTRALTYYKQYFIRCSGGSSDMDYNIILPSTIELSIGETKHYTILSGNCYNGAFDIKWKSQNPNNFAFFQVNWSTGDINISGAIAGEGTLLVKTVDGEEKECKIFVSVGEITTERRTEKTAVADIKSLISTMLTEFVFTRIEKNMDESESTESSSNIYNTNGILLKKNATENDINKLTPGIYIYKGKRILIKNQK